MEGKIIQVKNVCRLRLPAQQLAQVVPRHIRLKHNHCHHHLENQNSLCLLKTHFDLP